MVGPDVPIRVVRGVTHLFLKDTNLLSEVSDSSHDDGTSDRRLTEPSQEPCLGSRGGDLRSVQEDGKPA